MDEHDLVALRTDLAADPMPTDGLPSWRDAIRQPLFRGVVLVAVLAVVASLMLLRSGSPRAVAPTPSFSAAPVVASPLAKVPTVVIVDVSGKVRRPGLVRLPVGSRVADAVVAAGGARPGVSLDSLNLARILVDGEQVSVGVAAVAAGGGGVGGGVPSGPLSLNTATEQQLDALPGIGPVLAARIVAWRQQHGPFASVDSLADVPGIGPTMLSRLSGLVRV